MLRRKMSKTFKWCLNKECSDRRSVCYNYTRRRDKKDYICNTCKRLYTREEIGFKSTRSHYITINTVKVNRLVKLLRSRKYQEMIQQQRFNSH